MDHSSFYYFPPQRLPLHKNLLKRKIPYLLQPPGLFFKDSEEHPRFYKRTQLKSTNDRGPLSGVIPSYPYYHLPSSSTPFCIVSSHFFYGFWISFSTSSHVGLQYPSKIQSPKFLRGSIAQIDPSEGEKEMGQLSLMKLVEFMTSTNLKVILKKFLSCPTNIFIFLQLLTALRELQGCLPYTLQTYH